MTVLLLAINLVPRAFPSKNGDEVGLQWEAANRAAYPWYLDMSFQERFARVSERFAFRLSANYPSRAIMGPIITIQYKTFILT